MIWRRRRGRALADALTHFAALAFLAVRGRGR